MVTYSALRIVILGALLGILYGVGMRGWLLPLAAILLAFLVSYLTLRGPREAAARYLADRAAARAERGGRRPGRLARSLDEDAAAEDAETEAPQSDRPKPSSRP